MTSKKQTTDVQPERELTAGEIAAREAEKSALLAKLQARPREEGPVVDREAAAPATGSSKEILAEIERLKLAQHQERERSERAFNERIEELVKAQQKAEAAEARTVDPVIQSRLKAATAGLVEPVVDSAERIAEHERAEIQKQVDKVVKDAKEAMADIADLMDAHGDDIERLSKLSEDDLHRGLPKQGPDAHRAFALARQVTIQVGDLRDYVANSRRAAETLIQELQGLVRSAPVPFQKDTARYMQWLQGFNTAMRDLGRMTGMVPTANSKIGNLTGLVSALAELRARYRGAPETEGEYQTESPSRVIRDLDRPSPNRPRQDVAERLIDHDIFKS